MTFLFATLEFLLLLELLFLGLDFSGLVTQISPSTGAPGEGLDVREVLGSKAFVVLFPSKCLLLQPLLVVPLPVGFGTVSKADGLLHLEGVAGDLGMTESGTVIREEPMSVRELLGHLWVQREKWKASPGTF
jgi:hypothetical protein